MHNYPLDIRIRMKTVDENLVAAKSKAFAIRCIRLYDYLRERRANYVLNLQLLKSGTSVGANVKEAIRGQSRADFGSKMNLALKEASESEYWLELMLETGILTEEQAISILNDCRELLRLLTSIVKTTFQNQPSNA